MENTLKKIIDRLSDNFEIEYDTMLSRSFSELEFSDMGSYAKVYLIKGTDKVLRASHRSRLLDPSDTIKKVINKTFDNVVNIYYHRMINDDSDITIMERLYPLSQNEMDFIDELDDKFKYRFEKFIYNTDDFEDDSQLMKFSLYDDIREEVKSNADLFYGIKSGLEELKNIGIIHDDLHAGNIMRDTQGNIKIIDFY